MCSSSYAGKLFFLCGGKVARHALGGAATIFCIIIKKRTFGRRDNFNRQKRVGFFSSKIVYHAHRGLPPLYKFFNQNRGRHTKRAFKCKRERVIVLNLTHPNR